MLKVPTSLFVFADFFVILSDTTKIKTRCPHCQTTMKVSAKHVGQVAKCPVDGCGKKYQVDAFAPVPPKTSLSKTPLSIGDGLDSDNPFLDHIPDAAPPQTGITMSQGSYASNPGNLRVNPLRWILHKPKWPVLLALTMIGSVFLVSYSPGFLTGFALLFAGAFNFFYWRRVSDHFRFGCANPGVVVALNPTLIAVHTDLTRGEGQYPVVKIIKVNLTKSAGKRLELGDPVPTVALYSHQLDESSPHWSDFDPVPADYVTGSAAKIATVQSTFGGEDWAELRHGLKHIAQPFEPGLYVLWPEHGKQLGRRADFLDE